MTGLQRQPASDKEVTLIDELAARDGRVIVTLRQVNRWQNVRCRLVQRNEKDDVLFLCPEEAETTQGEPLAIPPGQRIGVSFRHDGGRYSFTSRLRRQDLVRMEDGEQAVLVVDRPGHVAMLHRRAYPRVPMQASGELRCVLWPGGLASEPTGEDPARPAWAGNVLDISVGGLCTCAERSARDILEIGDRVGGRLYVASTGVEYLFEARIRHIGTFAASVDSLGLQVEEAPSALAEAVAIVDAAHSSPVASQGARRFGAGRRRFSVCSITGQEQG